MRLDTSPASENREPNPRTRQALVTAPFASSRSRGLGRQPTEVGRVKGGTLARGLRRVESADALEGDWADGLSGGERKPNLGKEADP